MKIKQTNDEGVETEVEVVLADDHAKALADKDTAIATLAQEKEEIEKKIAQASEKDDNVNFKTLKEALNKKETEISSLRNDIESDKKTRVKEALDTIIKIATKGNDEQEAKVRLHMEKTLAALPENTAEERQTKLEAALKLSSDNDTPGIFDGGISTGGGGSKGFTEKAGGPEFTTREKQLGSKLGISEEDYKKYGPKLTSKIKN